MCLLPTYWNNGIAHCGDFAMPCQNAKKSFLTLEIEEFIENAFFPEIERMIRYILMEATCVQTLCAWWCFDAVQNLHASIRESLDLMSIGLGVEKRRNDTVGENTSSENPSTSSKDTGDVRWILYTILSYSSTFNAPIQALPRNFIGVTFILLEWKL